MARRSSYTPRVNVNELAKTMEALMQDYLNATYSNVEFSCKEVASEVVADLMETSPANTGQYARNWRNQYDTGNMWAKSTVYNNQYQLPHLLEFGHAKVKGGRTIYFDADGKKRFKGGHKVYNDFTKARPHVEPEQEKADELFVKLLKRRIEAGK